MKAGTLVARFFIVTVFLPVLATLFILSVIFQLFVLTYTKIFRPDLFLIFAGSELQYAMESIYRRPKVNTVIHCIFDGQIQLDYVRRQFERRVINYCDAQGNLRYQKLRQTWTQLCGYMFWKWDKHFSLRNQIRLYDYTEPELAIPSPCTEQDVSRVTGALISKPYMAGRSPWEILLIPNYDYVDSDGQTCNGSVLTFKLHHFLADGLSMFKLLNHLFEMRLPVPSANFPKLSPLQKCLRLATMAFKFPVDVAKIMTLGHDDPNSWHLTDKKLTRRYVTLASDRIPVPTIKAIKNKHCVGYNAAVYAVTVGAISRFMAAAGQEVPKSMTGYCPFPLPNHPGGLVNHWTSTILRFSPAVGKAAVRLKEIGAQLNDPYSTLPNSHRWLLKLVLVLPTPFIRFLVSTHASIVMTSLPGADKPVEIMPGLRLVDMFASTGNGVGSTGALACCLTTAGYQRIMVTVDELILSGCQVPTNFNQLVNQEVDELLHDMETEKE